MIVFLSVGLGWQLLVDTVRMVSPNYVIQLTAHNKHNNIDPLSLPRLSGHGWSRLSQVRAGFYKASYGTSGFLIPLTKIFSIDS